VLHLGKSLPSVIELLSVSPFSYIHHRFYVYIQEFTSRYQIFHRRISCELHRKNRHSNVCSFPISNVSHSIKEKEMSFRLEVNLHSMNENKPCETRIPKQNCHFHKVIIVGRNYLRKKSLMVSFNINLF